MNRYVIIGAGNAGLEAAATLLEKDGEARVDLFNSEADLPYFRPQLTKIIDDLSKLKPVKPKSFFSTPGLHFHPETTVKSVDTAEKRIAAGNKIYPYDKLIFCTGADAALPPIPNPGKARLFSIRSFADVQKLHVAAKSRRTAAVIGGGPLGLETAESLTRLGLHVTVYEIFSRILGRQTDAEAALFLTEFLKSNGISFSVGSPFTVTGPHHVAPYGELPRQTDVIVVSAGIAPRIRLAAECGLDVKKGITVNDRMQTSVSDIYAAGDCTEWNGKLCGMWLPAGDQGKTAAANAAGENTAYVPKAGKMMMNLFGKTILSLGTPEPKGEKGKAASFVNKKNGSYLRIFTDGERCTGLFLLGIPSEAAQSVSVFGKTTDSSFTLPDGFQ